MRHQPPPLPPTGPRNEFTGPDIYERRRRWFLFVLFVAVISLTSAAAFISHRPASPVTLMPANCVQVQSIDSADENVVQVDTRVFDPSQSTPNTRVYMKPPVIVYACGELTDNPSPPVAPAWRGVAL